MLDDNSETNKAHSIDSPKDEESQNIPLVPSNPPVLRTQSHDSQDDTSYKTEGKFCGECYVVLIKKQKTSELPSQM